MTISTSRMSATGARVPGRFTPSRTSRSGRLDVTSGSRFDSSGETAKDGMPSQGYDLQLALRRPRLARNFLHHGHGAQPDKRDGHRVGAHAVASGAGGSVERTSAYAS